MLWCLGTVGHFALTASWLKRAASTSTRDERWFQTMVVGAGTLSIALHLIASTTGLTIPSVLLVLAAGHAFAAWRTRLNVARAELEARDPGLQNQAELRPSVARAGLEARDRGQAELRRDRGLQNQAALLEIAAIVFLTAVVMQWALLALESAGVSGSDAAHYHVPNAVNLALGASLFDLPATSHLYPMGSSTLAAWFLLPVQTTLLTDLVMVLPFLLLLSSAGWLFRQLTSLSGLAWSTWLMLALFSTPLFRSASLMSADLLFAAATLAFGAAVLKPLMRRQLDAVDIWLIALSLGLLLGSKVTGVIVAVLLGVPALLALGIVARPGFEGRGGALQNQRALRKTDDTRTNNVLVWVGAAVAVLGAGGIWLIRNWWVWGSPVAPNGVAIFGATLFPGPPYAATNYLSVLGDIAETKSYQPWDRARHFVEVWLNPWYLLGLGALVLIPVDAIVSRSRGITAEARLWTMVVACGTGAVLAWFLVGAPWTSLEWTRGFSLRYALPWLALLPLVAWVGLFPASLPWYRNTSLAAIAGVAISAGSLLLFAGQHEVTFPPLPTSGVLFVAVAIVGARYALQLARPRWGWALMGTAVLGTAVLFEIWTGEADTLAQETKAAAMASGPRSMAEQIYASAIALETRDSRSCDVPGRRFFVTIRFDEAGALQGPRLTNQVFYAAREVRVTASVRPGMGPCDYLITERPVMDTDKGAALHAALNPSGTLVEVATVDGVVLLVHR